MLARQIGIRRCQGVQAHANRLLHRQPMLFSRNSASVPDYCDGFTSTELYFVFLSARGFANSCG